VLANEVPAPQQASRLEAITRAAGFDEAGAYLSEVEGLGASDIDADAGLAALRDDFNDYTEGPYWRAINRSEDLLLADCRGGEREAEQRRAVEAVCALVRQAYDAGRQHRLGLSLADTPAAVHVPA